MFETLFSYPKVVARHRNGPEADARERFLLHCAEQGLARTTLAHLAGELLVVARGLQMDRRQVSAQEIGVAADRWARHQKRNKRAQTGKWSRQWFIATATSWLSFIGRLKLSTNKIGPFADEMEQFVAFMRDERGLAAATIRNRCWHLATFFDSLPGHQRSLSRISLEEIDTYLARQGDHGWCRVSVSSAADALRNFFLYAEHQQWCSAGFEVHIREQWRHYCPLRCTCITDAQLSVLQNASLEPFAHKTIDALIAYPMLQESRSMVEASLSL